MTGALLPRAGGLPPYALRWPCDGAAKLLAGGTCAALAAHSEIDVQSGW